MISSSKDEEARVRRTEAAQQGKAAAEGRSNIEIQGRQRYDRPNAVRPVGSPFQCPVEGVTRVRVVTTVSALPVVLVAVSAATLPASNQQCALTEQGRTVLPLFNATWVRLAPMSIP